MAANETSNIIFIDPNQINSPNDATSPNFYNGVPQYEKMFIFVELIAVRRGRSSIIKTQAGITQKTEGLGNDIIINMLGVDPQTKEFTTRWANITTLSESPYEGFGITNINVNVNASFIPQVIIDFLDIRGMAMANKGKDSPYSIIFDFPPAFFQLTLKGYYGKALTYDLHLVKYSIDFEGTTGNYKIHAEFIARTFAPLTDVLFKYVEYFPLLKYGTYIPVPETINTSAKNLPKSTYELLKKLKSLYDQIGKVKNESQLAKEQKEAVEQQKKASKVYYDIQNFATRLNDILKNDTILAIIDVTKSPDSDTDFFRKINDISDYATVIRSSGINTIDTNFPKRLHLLIKRSPIISLVTNITESQRNARDKLISDALLIERMYLLREGYDLSNSNINKEPNSNDILPSKEATDNNIIINKPIITSSENATYTNYYLKPITNINDGNEYFGIDVTPFYQKIYNIWNQSNENAISKKEEIRNNINQLAKDSLGGNLPTLYFIFTILCNDVDTFFNILRQSAKDGENHHEKYKDQIYTKGGYIKDTKIGAYPRLAKEPNSPSIGNSNVNRLVRDIPSPKNLPNVPVTFPEVVLVDTFIEKFVDILKKRQTENLKTQIDQNQTNIWIPVTPVDSMLYNDDNYNSPYYNLYNTETNNSINNIYSIILNRFYIASQYTYPYSFYIENVGKGIDKNLKNLINFVAGAEAVNLVNSLAEKDIINALKLNATKWSTNPNGFYDELKQKNISNYNRITTNTTSPYIELDNNNQLFRNRINNSYLPFKLLYNNDLKNITIRADGVTTSKDTAPVDNYIINNTKGFFNYINNILGLEVPIKFTNENILYSKEDDYNSTNRFKSNYFYPYYSNFINIWSYILSEKTKITFSGSSYNISNDIRFKNILEETIITSTGYTNNAKAFIISSNFLSTIGIFTKSLKTAKLIKDLKYIMPMLIEAPKYVLAYMGGLVLYDSNKNFKDEIDRFFYQDIGKLTILYENAGKPTTMQSRLYVSNIELKYINKLSKKDKTIFLNYFNDFVNGSDFNEIKRNFITLIETVNDPLILGIQNKEKLYQSYLNDQLKYGIIPTNLSEKLGILNLTELTFSDLPNETEEFKPLSLITTEGTKIGGTKITPAVINKINDFYFKEFFRILSINLTNSIEKINKTDQTYEAAIDDNDIRTQTYYSFKSINDKWIVGPISAKTKSNNNFGYDDTIGYPFNQNGKKFIDNFMFVDRAMNPIGNDCIINVEPLLDMEKNYDISIFTVMSRLLSLNGFEFFPLQNFMVSDRGDWENSFKIFETANSNAVPAFVCMYLGGVSKTLNSDESSAYDDDGILDLEKEGADLKDFKNNEYPNVVEVNDKPEITGGNRKYPYGKVRAFRIRFAEQNQSLFKNIKIDSREYPETNESLAILSKIAGDENKSTPPAKGQNLFAIFENRSYSATIDMLGDMMLQPTQYFQLENIPIFSGAYMILSVEHNFIPNHATTAFKGVRILKYPNPIVTDFATSFGVISDTADDSENNMPIFKSSFGDQGAISIPNQAKHNAMFDLKLKPDYNQE